VMAMYNSKKSIPGLRALSFNMGCHSLPVYCRQKNNILKGYDGMFKDEFERIFDEE